MSAALRSCRSRAFFNAALLISALAQPAAAARPAWKPVSPAEFAETTPAGDGAAAAEIVFLNIEVDDRGYPQERKTTTYVRYKIFAPEKSDEITRVSGVEFAGSLDRTELHARLTSPNGRVQEFGKEAVKERPLVQQAKQAGFLGWLAGSEPAAKERFLAITGVARRGARVSHDPIRPLSVAGGFHGGSTRALCRAEFRIPRAYPG